MPELYQWIITATIRARYTAFDDVLVMMPNQPVHATLYVNDDGAVLIDGQFLDLGDDLPCVLGIWDAAKAALGRPVLMIAEYFGV